MGSPLFAASALAVTSLLVSQRAAVAQDQGWILSSTGGTTSPTATSGGGTGNWDTAANWSSNLTPTAAGRSNIDNGGTVIINFTGTEATNNDITTSGYQNNTTPGGQGTYIQQSGTLTCNGWFRMAEGANSGGTYNMTGGSITVNGYVHAAEGSGAVAAIDVGAGATFTVGAQNNEMMIGDGSGATGYLNITGGTFNENSTKGYGDIGANGGVGIMNISAGSYLSLVGTTDDFNICDAGSGSGTVNVSGTGLISIGYRFVYVSKFSGGTGTVNLNGGTISAGALTGYNYGTTTGGNSTVNFNGGTLLATGTGYNNQFMFGITNAYVQAGGANFNTGGYAMHINNVLQNGTGGGIDGGLNVSGGGVLFLDKSNSFTGNIVVTTSTLRFVTDGALGQDPSAVNPTNITLNNGMLLNNSANNLELNANRGIYVTAGGGYFEGGYGPGSPFIAGQYNPGGTTGGGIVINGPISGPGSIGVTFDASTVTLAGSDTYGGSTIVGSVGPQNNGNSYYNNITASPTLQLGSGNQYAIPAGSPLVFNQHPNQPTVTETLDLNGNSGTTTPLFGGVTSATSKAIIDNSSSSPATIEMGYGTTAGTVSTYVGVVRNSNGPVSVIETGAGTQILSGANTYNGSTSVLSGKLYVSGTIGSAAGSTLTVSGGTFGGSATVNSPATVAAGGTIEAGYLGVGSLNLTQGLAFTGNGNIQIGAVSAAGTNVLNVSGGTLDPGGNTVTINIASAAGLLAVGTNYPLVDYTGTLGSQGFSGFVLGTLPSRVLGTLYNNTSTDQIDLHVSSIDFLVWTGKASTGQPTGPWDVATTANWKLNSTGSPTTYTDSPGDSVLFDDTALAVPGPTTVTLASVVHPASVTFNNSSATYTLSGAGGIGGAAAVTQNGPGITTLAISNSYTGATLVNNGTLQAGSTTAFGNNSPVTIANVAAATLSLNGFNVSVGSLNGGGSTGGTVNLGANTLTDGGLNVNDEFDGAINGTGSLVKTGSATLTLTGASNYSGGTTILSGTLSATNVSDTGTSAIGTGPLTVTGVFNYAGGNGSSGVTARNVTLYNGGFLSASNAAGVLQLTGTVAATTTTGQGSINIEGTGTIEFNGNVSGQGFFPYGGTTIIGTGGVLKTAGYSSIALSAGSVATVTVNGNGQLIVNGDFNVSDLTGGFATLNIQGNALVTGNTAYIGKSGTATGVVNQTGGTYNQSGGGDFRIGGGTGTGDYASVGIWNLSGSGNVNNPNNLQIGAYGNGELNISGNGAWSNTGGFSVVGRFLNTGSSGQAYGVLDVSDNGTFTNTANHLIIGEQANGTLNIRGNGTVSTSGTLWVGGTEANDTATGQVNLDGGTLNVPGVLMGATSDLSTFNFNGGLLRATASSTTFMQGLTNAYVGSGGAFIDSAGNSITIGQNLQNFNNASGGPGGVTSIAVSSGGSGYTVAPIVQISGGNGFGATAVAQMSGGAITGIIVTNPGVGYTSTPTITLLNGLSGGSGATFNPALNNLSSGGLTVYSTATGGTLTLTGSNSYTGATNVSSGALAIAVDQALPAGTNVTVKLGATLVLPDMTALTSVGSLNMNGNMIVQNGTLGPVGTAGTVTALVAAGYNGGNWNGPGGITSSSATSDATHLHALGVIQNSVDGTTGGGVLYGYWEYQNSVDTDVLVKYTWYGDADLNGKVDGTDYSRIDAAFVNNQTAGPAAQMTGWFNGDFNYDGVIDGSDYTLMDNAYNMQGAQISAQIAAQIGSSAVPEPASLALLGIGAVGLLGRRRRAR